MNGEELQMTPALRRAIYAILVISTLASCLGRIVTVRSRDGRGPFQSANDRSRWCTIRNLVDHNTFAIDRLQRDKQWFTIDKVRHKGPDGKLHYYSSKPPLFPTLVAGQYWLMRNVAGAAFEDHPFPITRSILAITNWLPLVLYFWLLVGLIERWCETDWAKIFAVGVAAWGTFITTFSVTLNNHLPAAICTLIALHVFIAIWYDDSRNPWLFVAAGFSAAFAAANELPALSLLGLLGLALLYKNWKCTLLYGVPAVASVVVAFFVLTYVAHGSWRPPYMHRNSDVPGTGQHGDDNWYDYDGSHWSNKDKKGVDAGEPSKVLYALHSLVGHHGVISLTPVWLFSVYGVILLASYKRDTPMPTLAIGIAILTIVCLCFYLLLRPVQDRNYGGVCSGFRWMFWFIPLWLFAMLPMLDKLSTSIVGRRFAYVCLAISVLSASYPSANPWQHPWPYQMAEYLGWVG